MLNTLIHIVRHEFSHHEFTAIVGAQNAQLVAALYLSSSLHTPDGVRSLSLASLMDHNSYVAREVVNEQ
jgi:hypothetical protein